MFPPERIICLTEETVETLCLLGEDSRIVGISGYVVRPPKARREKPRVSAFTSADIPKILDLQPDLVRRSPIFKPISQQRSSAPTSRCTRSINAPSRKFST
jgi:ABC-type Fe3+-hydroxamate transport system substrate-binding protein